MFDHFDQLDQLGLAQKRDRDELPPVIREVSDHAHFVVDNFKAGVETVGAPIIEGIGVVYKAVDSVIGGTVKTVGKACEGAVEAVVGTVMDGVGVVYKAVDSALSAVGSWFSSWF